MKYKMHFKELIEWIWNFPAGGGRQTAFAGVPGWDRDGRGSGSWHDTGDANFFGSRQAPLAPPRQEMPPLPPIEIPKVPPPLAPPPPPPSESKIEVEEAAAQQRRDAKRRQGMAKSLLAGETGGYKSSATDSGSLLG